MNRTAALALLLAAACATARPGHVQAADSSGDSANSSAGSGQSSAGSADSSKTSGATSQNSADSSKSSNESSKTSSNGSTAAQADSTQATTKQTTGPLVSTTVIAVTFATVGLTVWGLPNRRASLDEQRAAAYAFVRASSLDIEADLAVGEGRFLENVAGAAGIAKAHFPAFAAALHAYRGELLDLADDASLTPERALGFLERIGTIARAEPALADDRARFAGTHGDEG